MCFLPKLATKNQPKHFHYQHLTWGPKHNFWFINLFLYVNLSWKISRFISQTSFTKLKMLFFIVWKQGILTTDRVPQCNFLLQNWLFSFSARCSLMSRKWLGPIVPKFDCFVLFCVKIFTLPHCGGLSIVNRPCMLHTQAGCFFLFFCLQNMGYSCAKCAILFVHVGVIMSKIYGLQLLHFFHAQRVPRGHLKT